MTLQAVKNLASLSARATSLAGTVPAHKAYILLHGQHSPRAFPSRLASPLLTALRQHALRWSALINVAWVPPNGGGHVSNLSEEETDDTETYGLLAFASNRRRLSIPSVSMDNFEDTCVQLNNYMEQPSTGVVDPYGLHLVYCRCGEWGSKVADAFREEIFKRRQTDPTGQYSWIVMGEVGHVGGHQHAANVLVFPYGEWLGQLRPKDVPGVLDTIVKQPSSMDLTRTPLITHWRGRMGLNKEEQLKRYLLASR
ncbi:hypothetical protein BGY98DRAFT_982394 [Russula aff. rugulosa BPL654]|nr:hypothetical protein BGY98DRAFT_982394 [Russula aff. rugulosa BPL654]